MTKLDVKALLASFGIFFGVIDMANAGEPVAEGQEIYESFCAACHGSDGKPMIPDAPNFSSGERMEKTDAELLVSIMEGKGDVMPSWSGILSDEDCDQVLLFLRSGIARTP